MVIVSKENLSLQCVNLMNCILKFLLEPHVQRSSYGRIVFSSGLLLNVLIKNVIECNYKKYSI